MQSMITMVTISNMNRSVAFYQDTLGLKLRFQSPEWTEFEVGSTTLALHGGGTAAPPAEGNQQVAGRASIGFNVDNVDQLFDTLQGKGVRFVMPPTERQGEGIRLAVCLDPDGFPVSFAQTLRSQPDHARH